MGMGARTRRMQRIRRAMPIVDQLVGHGGELDGVWWARRVDRSDGPVWLSTPFSVNGRGGEPLDESNYHVISEDLDSVAAFGADYRIDAWPGGTIHTLTVRADDALALRCVQRWVDALADYPIADEEDLSKREWEHNHPTHYLTGEILECYGEDDCSCGYVEWDFEAPDASEA